MGRFFNLAISQISRLTDDQDTSTEFCKNVDNTTKTEFCKNVDNTTKFAASMRDLRYDIKMLDGILGVMHVFDVDKDG